MATWRAPSIRLPGVLAALRSTKELIARSVQSLSEDDPGCFGPGSVSWRIFSHASFGASGIAAVLVQALHPIAMATVDRNSVFRTDAWRRAHLTADYVFTITFGGRRTAEAAAERVREIHRHITSVDPQTGIVHRADEPELLLWVHAVHTEYSLRGYETLVGQLDRVECDRFVAEQVTAAELVGLPQEIVPATRSELNAYLESVPGLAVTEPAAQFAQMLLKARMPLTMRPFWALHILAVAQILPPEIRRSYRLPRLPTGPLARAAVRAAFSSMNYGYLLFRPVRQARAKLKRLERSSRADSMH